jgi:hypothetical protein
VDFLSEEAGGGRPSTARRSARKSNEKEPAGLAAGEVAPESVRSSLVVNILRRRYLQHCGVWATNFGLQVVKVKP